MTTTYTHTHVSVHDGSPAMLVSQDEETITLVNEDGYEWTDPASHWQPVSEPTPILALLMTFEDGDLDLPEVIDLFSRLVSTGMAWSLQGVYGRTAVRLIRDGFLSETGEVLVDVEAL